MNTEPIKTEDLPAEFPARLRAIRKHRKMTQEDVDVKSGLYQTQISRLERGEGDPAIKTLKLLCTSLDCTSYQLLGF